MGVQGPRSSKLYCVPKAWRQHLPPSVRSNLMHFIPWLCFKFQNIHKNTRYLHSLLETLQLDTDLLFLQEVPFYHIQNITSLHSEDGEPLNGTTHHPAWMCASKFPNFPNTQVAIFVNRHILGEYAVFTDPFSVPNPNVLELKLTKLSDNASTTFFCLYNPPKSRNSAIHDLMTHFPEAPQHCTHPRQFQPTLGNMGQQAHQRL